MRIVPSAVRPAPVPVPALRLTPNSRTQAAVWAWLMLAFASIADVWTTPQQGQKAPPSPSGAIRVDTAPVPLVARDSSVTSVGDFRYAGGLMLTSTETDLLHELSDIAMIAPDRFVAVGDEGVLFEARLQLDEGGRLVGLSDTTLARLVGKNGKPLNRIEAEAEGLAVLANGDRLVSFERRPRIWLYPKDGGPPRDVPSPRVRLETNAGMEALSAQPEAGPDGYLVGVEGTAAIWSCQLATQCIGQPSLDRPDGFGLVAMHHVAEGTIAYLLRAYDPVHQTRVTLQIRKGGKVIARLDLAAPMTVDNFEGITTTPGPNGSRRFYLLSDDNNQSPQRTLLLAFDWLQLNADERRPKNEERYVER